MVDITSVTNRRQAVKALKGLGFTEPGYVMTRGTKFLTGFGLSVTLAPDNFMVLDKTPQAALGFIPMLCTQQQCDGIWAQLYAKGIVPADVTELTPMGLAVGIAMLGVCR